MFDPEVKEPLIKILLFLYKLRVYRKRMVSASHKYHLKNYTFIFVDLLLAFLSAQRWNRTIIFGFSVRHADHVRHLGISRHCF